MAREPSVEVLARRRIAKYLLRCVRELKLNEREVAKRAQISQGSLHPLRKKSPQPNVLMSTALVIEEAYRKKAGMALRTVSSTSRSS